MSRQRSWMRPRGAQGSEMRIAYLVELLCPHIKDINITRLGIHPFSLRGRSIKKRKYKTLRESTKEYGVSHETVKRTIKRKAVKQQNKAGYKSSR